MYPLNFAYPNFVPHSPQNLKPSATSVPQVGQTEAAGASNLLPHSKQNFVPSAFTAPHAEHTFPAGAACGTGAAAAFTASPSALIC